MNILKRATPKELNIFNNINNNTINFNKTNNNKTKNNKQVSVTTALVRSHGRSIHKRSTLELLVRAKTLSAHSGTGAVASHAVQASHSAASQDPATHYSHRFEKYNYATPAYCDHCSSVLWGPVKAGKCCRWVKWSIFLGRGIKFKLTRVTKTNTNDI